MAAAATINRDWIETEFSKGIDAEQALADEAKARAKDPPDASLAVLYHEIAADDERHRAIVETIATRYGHTPSRTIAGGIGETLGRLKDKVGELGTTPLQRISHDLCAKASAIHWCTAWIGAFEAIGDSASARDLSSVLDEEKRHHEALQQNLNRLVLQGAAEPEEAPAPEAK
jgi:rubrerythrin